MNLNILKVPAEFFQAPIQEAPVYARVMFRRPRTKKRRTVRKWAARPINWKSIPSAYMYRGVVYAHPSIVRALRASTQEEDPKQ